MKKKIILLLCSLACVFLLTSCGASNEDYNGYTREDLLETSEKMAESLQSLDSSEIAMYQAYYEEQAEAETDESDSAAIKADLLSDWEETYPMLGKFQSFSDFSVDKTGKTLTTTLTLHYTDRDAKLVYVYTTYNMKVSSIHAEPVYTLGETMARAGLNTLMGICTVFIILILISLVIYAFRLIPYFQNKKKPKTDGPTTEELVAEAEKRYQQNASETADEELVAVISAAISAATGESTDSFVVRSIKRRF